MTEELAFQPRRRRPTSLGPYELVAPLGRGATAQVFLGQHMTTGERVAIKVLEPSYQQFGDVAQRLLAEHDLASRASHPGLLRTHHAAYSDTGAPFVVMEYLDGESLHALLDRVELELDTVIMIAAQVAEAIAELHDAGVIHCDLKPANIYVLYEPGLGGYPRIKVVDFGVARLACEGPLPDNAIAGTPAFMAPEQWHGDPCSRSDVYALGCILYELVTDRPLFSGTLPRLMVQHCEQLPERPSLHCPDIPPELERLIVRALAKDPAMRPSMAELADDLSRLCRVATIEHLDAVG